MKAKKLFFWILGISTCIRIVLAGIVPITGDEAYFIIWAKHLNYGYYEHPPMIGWVMWLLSFLGDKIFVYRLFPLIVMPAMAFLMVKLLREINENKAYLCTSAFLLSPISILNVLSVNDVPLIFFTFLSGIFLYRALKRNKLVDAVLSGFFGGCAFLSKYFFIIFIFALFVFGVISGRKRIKNILAIFFLSAFPLIFINLFWNYNNCWLNITFNLFFRNKDLAFNFLSAVIYVFEQSFLMTPFLAILFIKNKFLLGKLTEYKDIKIFWYLFMVPLVFFLLLSFVKKIGLHWTVSFYPFFFILQVFLGTEVLDRAIKYNFYISMAILVFVLVISALPVEVFQSVKKYPQIVMFMKPTELCGAIHKEMDNRILASTGYTETSVLAYYCKKKFVLFGSMSRSGRYFDFINDFRDYDGKDFLIVSLSKRDAEKFTKFFKKIALKVINISGSQFYFIFGECFLFNEYRDLYLRNILKNYYSPPSFLPVRINFFKEKYFSE